MIDNSERNENIIKAWTEGLTTTLIGKQFGISREIVSGIIYRAREAGDLRAGFRASTRTVALKVWTPEMDARLREMWPGRLTIVQIAKELGMRSKNSVMNRGTRLGLGPRGIAPKREYAPHVDREGSWTPLEGQEPVHLLDLSLGVCRWPVNVPERLLMSCGAPVDAGSVYCKHHREMSCKQKVKLEGV